MLRPSTAYFTVAEIVEKLGIHPRTVQNMLQRGEIAGAVSLGAAWLIPEGARIPLRGRGNPGKKTPMKTLLLRETDTTIDYRGVTIRFTGSFDPVVENGALVSRVIRIETDPIQEENGSVTVETRNRAKQNAIDKARAYYGEGFNIEVELANLG